MPDSYDSNTSERATPRFAWGPRASAILFGLVVVCVIVALFFLRGVLSDNFGGCTAAPGCSVSRAPGP